MILPLSSSVIRVSKIRLYPTVSQEVTLLETLSLCKDAWNALKALIYGAKRVVQVVKQALRFGCEAASSWTMDKGFLSYLTALDFNQPPGFWGVDGP